MKTNAARMLDQARVSYRLAEYEVDEEDLAAETVARKVGLPPGQVFKTLALRGDRTGVLLAMIPAGTELDLKALAQVSDNKRCELLPLKEVLPVTGYVRGGVSPLGTRKRFPVFLDASAQDWEFISLSAGVRGTQLLVAPGELLRVVQGCTGALARPMAPAVE